MTTTTGASGTLKPFAADGPVTVDDEVPLQQHKPEIRERRTVARSRLFEVEALDLTFSNGVQTCFERLVSRGHGAVLIIPLTNDDHILMIREYAAGTDRYELALPKGRIESGEAILEAANREMMEEVGHGARELIHLTAMTVAPGYMGHQTEIVLARDLYPATAEGDEPEPIEVVRWPLADLSRLLSEPECTEARSIAALFLTREFLAGQFQPNGTARRGGTPPKANR
ncbi:MAG: ADP compounds hydrolase NudE [Thioalkalivibrionaceae bacterium]